MRFKASVLILFFLFASLFVTIFAQEQEELPPPEQDEAIIDQQNLPEEPKVEGGILSSPEHTQLEPRQSSEDLEALPIDDPSSPKNSQFLVEDALQILSSLSKDQESNEATSNTVYMRILLKLVEVLKSVSFLQYASQEEPLATGSKTETYQRALSLLTEAAEAGNEEAIYLLAEINFYGKYARANYREAYKWYQKMTQTTSNATAQHMLGFMHATGIGNAVQPDQGAALLYHTFAAVNGNLRSEMTVAYRHLMGIGTPRSCEEAVVYYKSVADKSIAYYRSGPPGGRHLPRNTIRIADDEGGVYGQGASHSSAGQNAYKRNSVMSDSSQSIDDVLEYLRYMADKGDAGAQFSLARVYYDGSRTITRNFQRALFYFGSVARQHWAKDGKIVGKENQSKVLFGSAAGYLGLMHMRGEGVPQSFEKAKIWFQRGVDLGDSISQYGMGMLHLLGVGEVPKDQGKALQHFKASAEQNHPPAQVAIAKMYLDQNEIIIATRYFELAARQGHVEAFYYLAELNHKGIGRERSCGIAAAYYKIVAERVESMHSTLADANAAWKEGLFTEAMVGYMMAAEQGYEAGQANVAWLIDQTQNQGRQVILQFLNKPRNHEADNMALIYWTRSARQANVDSLVKMGDWYLYGYGLPAPDPVKAAACYLAAAEGMSALAMWNLGWCHENGIGVEQDFHLAKRYYDMAALTNSEAQLPVQLALIKLRIRSFYNKITHGKVNSIGTDDYAVKIEDNPKWSFAQAFKDIWRKWTEGDLNDVGGQNPQQDVEDYLADGYIPPDPDYEEFDEDFVESLILIALCGAIALLLWWRNMRQVRFQREQRLANNEQNANAVDAAAPPAELEENRGLFPDPNDAENPEFARWIGGAPII